MTLIELPNVLYQREESVNYDAAEHIQNRLYYEYNIEVSQKDFSTNIWPVSYQTWGHGGVSILRKMRKIEKYNSENLRCYI